MRKHNKWITSLNTFITESHTKSFTWGEHDCCLFAADAVKCMTDRDPAKAFRGKYSTELGAMRALKRYGQGDILSTLNHIFGKSIPKLQAQRGDIAYLETEQGPTAGIVYGGNIIAPSTTGLAVLSITLGLHFWSVDKWQ